MKASRRLGHHRTVLLLLVLSAIFPSVTWCNEEQPEENSRYILTAGVSFHSTDFDVYDEGSTNTKGTLSEDFSYLPFVIVGSPYRYFGKTSDAGWYMEYGLSPFRLTQQSINDELVDLGTSVKGWHAYVTPVVFYNFGDRSIKGHSFKIGLGGGVGYLRAKGDLILTETPSQERLDFNINGFGVAAFVFLEYRMNPLMVRVTGAGPSVTDNNLDFDIFSFSVDLGYTFEL